MRVAGTTVGSENEKKPMRSLTMVSSSASTQPARYAARKSAKLRCVMHL